MRIEDVLTPALLLDADILEKNLARMQEKVSGLGSSLRPHIKTHKCTEIAQRQRMLGAKGITVSTFYEAEQFANRGFNDITWAFPLPPVYASRAMELSKRITFRIVIDSTEALENLEKRVESSDGILHVWLKIDCGYHRAGVDPLSPLAEIMIRKLSESRALKFDGILSHSGHAYYGTSRKEILNVANQEREVMVDFAERMRSKGLPVPAISIGSTPSTALIESLDGITEVRPGNYCFYDRTMTELGVCGPGDCAVTVLATVVSHQPGAKHFVVDAGALALSKDPGPVQSNAQRTMGLLFENYEETRLCDHLVLGTLTQEHGKVIADTPSRIEGRYRVGDRVRILENHSCLTVANFDEYYVIRGTEIVDKWKILRGRM